MIKYFLHLLVFIQRTCLNAQCGTHRISQDYFEVTNTVHRDCVLIGIYQLCAFDYKCLVPSALRH